MIHKTISREGHHADRQNQAQANAQHEPEHEVDVWDFDNRNPKPLFSLVCILTALAAAVFLLWWAGKGLRLWAPAFGIGFLVGFLLPFGLSIPLWWSNSEVYVSTARLKLADWTHPAFP